MNNPSLGIEIDYLNNSLTDEERILRFFNNSQLNNINVNSFLSFLKNPDDFLKNKKLVIGDVNGMIDMVENLIDISCSAYLEYECPKKLYRYEYSELVKDYDKNVLNCFKSSSVSKAVVETVFKGNGELVELIINDGCFFIPVDKLIHSNTNIDPSDENEFLFPPFLDCRREGNKIEVFFSSNEMDYNSYDVLVGSGKDDYEEAIKVFNKEIKHALVSHNISDDLKKACNMIYQHLYYYARSKYMSYQRMKEEQKESISQTDLDIVTQINDLLIEQESMLQEEGPSHKL